MFSFRDRAWCSRSSTTRATKSAAFSISGNPHEPLVEVKYRLHIDQSVAIENQRGDLTDLKKLGIIPRNVADREALIRCIFGGLMRP